MWLYRLIAKHNHCYAVGTAGKVLRSNLIFNAGYAGVFLCLKKVPHQKAFQFDRKPVYNGSAIFPVFHTQKQQTRILFMGYWMVKKKINEIGLLVSLRNQYGELISRYSEQIINPAAKEIELIDLLKESNCLDNEFTGSIELEVFSSRDHSF